MTRRMLKLLVVLATGLLLANESQARTEVPSNESSRCMIWYGICECTWIQTCPGYSCVNGSCKADE
jgi:hypothetical protein